MLDISDDTYNWFIEHSMFDTAEYYRRSIHSLVVALKRYTTSMHLNLLKVYTAEYLDDDTSEQIKNAVKAILDRLYSIIERHNVFKARWVLAAKPPLHLLDKFRKMRHTIVHVEEPHYSYGHTDDVVGCPIDSPGFAYVGECTCIYVTMNNAEGDLVYSAEIEELLADVQDSVVSFLNEYRKRLMNMST